MLFKLECEFKPQLLNNDEPGQTDGSKLFLSGLELFSSLYPIFKRWTNLTNWTKHVNGGSWTLKKIPDETTKQYISKDIICITSTLMVQKSHQGKESRTNFLWGSHFDLLLSYYNLLWVKTFGQIWQLEILNVCRKNNVCIYICQKDIFSVF